MFQWLLDFLGNQKVQGLTPDAAAKEFRRQAQHYVKAGDLVGLRALFVCWVVETSNWNRDLDIVARGLMEEGLQYALLEPSRKVKRGCFSYLGSSWWPGKGE